VVRAAQPPAPAHLSASAAEPDVDEFPSLSSRPVVAPLSALLRSGAESDAVPSWASGALRANVIGQAPRGAKAAKKKHAQDLEDDGEGVEDEEGVFRVKSVPAPKEEANNFKWEPRPAAPQLTAEETAPQSRRAAKAEAKAAAALAAQAAAEVVAAAAAASAAAAAAAPPDPLADKLTTLKLGSSGPAFSLARATRAAMSRPVQRSEGDLKRLVASAGSGAAPAIVQRQSTDDDEFAAFLGGATRR
jgi:hypothetical protein